MRNLKKMHLLVLSFLFSFIMSSQAEVTIDKPAPAFELINQVGKTIRLNEFKGKAVVLEWYNQDCPFVRKFYDAKKMQELQAQAKKQGIVWLTIASSAPGKQGHLTQKSAQNRVKVEGSKASHILLDPSGDMGQAYGAKTTPHMFIIGAEGDVLYDGAIDSVPSTNINDIKQADNYIEMALQDLSLSRPIKMAKTRPYGCSVKYP